MKSNKFYLKGLLMFCVSQFNSAKPVLPLSEGNALTEVKMELTDAEIEAADPKVISAKFEAACQAIYRTGTVRYKITELIPRADMIELQCISYTPEGMIRVSDGEILSLLGVESEVRFAASRRIVGGTYETVQREFGNYTISELCGDSDASSFVLHPNAPVFVNGVRIDVNAWFQEPYNFISGDRNKLSQTIKCAESLAKATGEYTVSEAFTYLLAWWNFEASRGMGMKVNKVEENLYELAMYNILPLVTNQDSIVHKTMDLGIKLNVDDVRWYEEHFEGQGLVIFNHEIMKHIPSSNLVYIKFGSKKALINSQRLFKLTDTSSLIERFLQEVNRIRESIGKDKIIEGIYEGLDPGKVVSEWLQ